MRKQDLKEAGIEPGWEDLPFQASVDPTIYLIRSGQPFLKPVILRQKKIASNQFTGSRPLLRLHSFLHGLVLSRPWLLQLVFR